jgi:hypothetical protein
MQHPVNRSPDSARPTVIDVDGEPQGVLVRNGDAFRFLAVRFPVFSIDGQQFLSVEEAQAAAQLAVRNAPDEA